MKIIYSIWGFSKVTLKTSLLIIMIYPWYGYQLQEEVVLPWGYVIGANFFSLSFSMVSWSSLKSSLVPTSIIGVFGQWWLTSGYHWMNNRRKLEITVFNKLIMWGWFVILWLVTSRWKWTSSLRLVWQLTHWQLLLYDKILIFYIYTPPWQNRSLRL